MNTHTQSNTCKWGQVSLWKIVRSLRFRMQPTCPAWVCVCVCERVSATTSARRRYISFFLIGEYVRSSRGSINFKSERALRCVAIFSFHNHTCLCVCVRLHVYVCIYVLFIILLKSTLLKMYNQRKNVSHFWALCVAAILVFPPMGNPAAAAARNIFQCWLLLLLARATLSFYSLSLWLRPTSFIFRFMFVQDNNKKRTISSLHFSHTEREWERETSRAHRLWRFVRSMCAALSL